MSGDVQPRKRKDKKKKKDDLGIEEPRGTAAALGEGDIFMHSYQEHGTGGHWCAKVIFFSLLAVLVTLVGLIILENRGLSELEANSVETRYSGVLEGWLEDGHDDAHHDEHTLELKHHDDEDDDDHDEALDHDEHGDEELSHEEDDEEESNEAENDEESNEAEDDEENQDDDQETQDDDQDENEDDDQDENEDDDNRDNDDDDENSQEADDDDNEDNLETAENEEEVEENSYRRYYRSTDNQIQDDDDDDDDDDDKNNDDDQSAEKDDNDQQIYENEDDDDDDSNNSEENNDEDNDDDENDNNKNSQEIEEDDDKIDERNDQNDDDDENEQDEDDEDHEDHNDHEEDPEVELEHIEEEVFDEDVAKPAPPPPARREPEESEEESKEADPADDDDDIEMLEPGDIDDLPEELPIPVPKGRPLVEVEDSPSTEKPHDTLAEEEEYERQQEALRKEKEEASQGMWLKLVVGGALLVATQAVLRRATAPRDNEEGDTTREATPLTDRRMTLITEPVPPPTVTPKPQELSRPVVEKEVVRQAPIIKSAPPPPPEEEEEELDVEEEEEIVVEKDDDEITAEKDKELYSDEEEVEDEEEEEIEPPKPMAPVKERPNPTFTKPVTPLAPAKPPVKEVPDKKEPPKVVEKEPTPEEDEDDVEIIEEEDIGEDLEEEEDDISDVDDAELLSRLEAKYGRLPEPERPGKQKDGGNSIEDEWPGEPSDAYWREELDQAERDLRQGEWTSAAQRASAAELRSSGRARFLVARAYDQLAEAKRDNGLLSKAVAAYLELLKMNEKLTDKKLMEVAERTVDRMKFRGSYLSAEPVYRLLIRRFSNNPAHRNNLTISFLMANRMDLAEEVIKETLKQWPDDRIALANYGFILKTLHKNYEKAVEAFSKALEGDIGDANEPRYYYHLGDALLLLGRFKEAHEVHKRGAKLGHFLSPAQRSLYNVNRLKSKPWWDVEKTPYKRLAQALEKSWKEILKEGRAAQALYEEEKEGLREKGEWSQLDLFARGREVAGRCARAPITCGIVRSEAGASGCRRGQIKFSLMEPGTHVRPHVGPTNCRLRMHLGLSNTRNTYIRVDQEIRQWQVGNVLMFDDSFEHEVWHNGTGARLVLIVDVWHPDLTRAETHQLPAI